MQYSASFRRSLAAFATLSAIPASRALQYANPGGSPDNVGTWIGADDIWTSFEFPSGSFRTWYDPEKGLLLEEMRYESWECTDVAGASRAEYVHIEIMANGTAITDSGCMTTKLSDDFTFSQTIYHECDEEPAIVPDGDWYTNFRLNSTAVPAPTALVCTGSPVAMDTSGIGPHYEGAGSVAKETISIGDPLPPFESVNANGLIDYSTAVGKPFDDGLYYHDVNGTGYFALKDNLVRTKLTATTTGNVTAMELIFQRNTGYEQVPPGQVYTTSFVESYMYLNGTINGTSTACGLLDSTDPYETLVAPKEYLAADCPTSAQQATNVQTRLLFFPPQVDIETASEEVNAALVFATASDMNGANEQPPIDTPVTAAFLMNKPNEQGWVTFDLDVNDITGMTMAHIHAGNSKTNGPPVVELTPTSKHWPTPIVVSGGLPMFNPSLNATNAEFVGAFSAADFIGPLANSTMDDFIKQIAESEENFYVNVHNDAHPAGVVRAQLKAVGTKPGPSPGPSPNPSPAPSPKPPMPSPSAASVSAVVAAVAAAVGMLVVV